LAEHQIGLFAVSTYNTDYILVKQEDLDRALAVLSMMYDASSLYRHIVQ